MLKNLNNSYCSSALCSLKLRHSLDWEKEIQPEKRNKGDTAREQKQRSYRQLWFSKIVFNIQRRKKSLKSVDFFCRSLNFKRIKICGALSQNKKNAENDIREVSWHAEKTFPFQAAGDEVGEKKLEVNIFRSYRSKRWPEPTASCKLDFPCFPGPLKEEPDTLGS